MIEDITFLHQYSLFAGLRDDQLRLVASIVEPTCFYAGHTLFEEGQPADKLYGLVESEVEVLYAISEEGPARVDVMTAGNLVGCSALVPPYCYTSTARTLTEAEVLAVDIAGLHMLSEQHA
jgi:CRP/FNR family cyclic AMP-dependent transcriptional regulator